MILLISIDHDPITPSICQWLLHMKKPFKILYGEDVVRLVKIEGDSMVIKNITGGYEIDLNSISKIFYRQGDILITPEIHKEHSDNVVDFLTKENKIIRQYLYHKIKQIDHLGHPQLADLNKLIILDKASKFNLLIPEYIFTSQKSDLVSFRETHKQVITKIILSSYSYEVSGNNYFSYTEELTRDDVASLGENFHPTFFQKLITKKFDVRVFFLDNKFYSIAVVSQNNDQTKIDSRNYDRALPNRQIPFQLPESVQKKLQALIVDLNLKYCSIDLIYGHDKKIYFLEINPIGQFGNVSYFGNYHLDKKISELICT
ncbi:MAG: grasp-with-spasm system ATP-grasp peptide maturase [Bacteroidia bacterium]|nr:grasp-with-spasm system ATP-grasp peptide maturase [Bacteroidia bacterium]